MNVLRSLESIPCWAFGVLGATAISYRHLAKLKRPSDIDLVDLSASTAVGYVLCETVPFLAPVIIAGVLFEDYHRSKRDREIRAFGDVGFSKAEESL